MSINQLKRPGQHNGLNFLLQKLPVQPVQGVYVVLGQGFEAERQKFVNIQGSGFVLFVEPVIFPFIALAIHKTLFNKELSPQMVAVTS